MAADVQLPRTQFTLDVLERIAARPSLHTARSAETALTFWTQRLNRMLTDGIPPGSLSVETARLGVERALAFLHEGRTR